MKVYLETFGCQMNELDSELVRSHLASLGYGFTDSPEDASVVLYNTCSVREHAEQKAYSRIGIVGKRKAAGEEVILGVLGCMAERDGIDLLRRYPQVDLLCGPGELDKVPLLIDNARRTRRSGVDDRVALAGNRSRRTATLAAAEDSLEALDLSRSTTVDRGGSGVSAYVRITRGCNKFCTYCVVPYTRGAEVHRPPDHIVEECRRLVDGGAVEITLLGQTVNHYVYVHGSAVDGGGGETPQVGPGPTAFTPAGRARLAAGGQRVTSFADLLHRIHEDVPELRRLRFVTSYPRDFGDDILDVMAACPRICRYLHVPAQSGSDRILKLMNRGYTVAEYRAFAQRVLERLPDATIAGDIIVGFPSETDEDFAATVDLVRAIPFKNNFIFKYSPRPGTVAIDRFEDDVPDEVKRYRNNALLAVQSEVSLRAHQAWVGREVEVLVEGFGRSDRETTPPTTTGAVELRIGGATPRQPSDGRPRQLRARTPGDLITFFDAPLGVAPESLIGRIVRVTVTGAGALLLTARARAIPASTTSRSDQ